MEKYYYKSIKNEILGPVNKEELFSDPDVTIHTMVCLSSKNIEKTINWFPCEILFTKDEDNTLKINKWNYRKTIEINPSETINTDSPTVSSINRKDIGKVMLVLSILMGIYGFTMDISYSSVVNLGLMHKQTTTLIVSGFLFIGSLITMFIGNEK